MSLKFSLVYRACSRTARTTQRNAVSKKSKTNQTRHKVQHLSIIFANLKLYVDEVGFELIGIHLPASATRVLGLKVRATICGL